MNNDIAWTYKSGIKFMLKKAIVFILFAILFVALVTAFSIFVVFLDVSVFGIANDAIAWLAGILSVATVAAVIYWYGGEIRLVARWVGLFYSSFLLCLVFALLFGDGPWWYGKYIIGVLVGLIAMSLNIKSTGRYAGYLVSGIAFIAILATDVVVYMQIMDPLQNPSVLYRKTFQTNGLWFMSVLIVVIPAFVITAFGRGRTK